MNEKVYFLPSENDPEDKSGLTLETVPEHFKEQFKISKDQTNGKGINNIFKPIDFSEADDVLSLVLDDEERKKVEEKAQIWNVSFTGDEHQFGDRIFWIYFIEGESRKLYTCNQRQFDILNSEYEFVQYHEYKGLEKSSATFQMLFEMEQNADNTLVPMLDSLFPIFKKK